MAAVAAAKPRRLFLACDGPRRERPAEIDQVLETRAVLDSSVQWDCEVTRRYSETNQGCREGVTSAINWFFEHVEEGIILEDDCVPHADFFPYCAELLAKFRDNDSVMHISGDASLRYPRFRGKASYAFTSEALVWGWATWRRAWNEYDEHLTKWLLIRDDAEQVDAIFRSRSARAYWTNTMDKLLFQSSPDTWDYIWSFSVFERAGVAIVPRRNLITNVGHRSDSTHTFDPSSPRADCPTEPILPLLHPAAVRVDHRVERQFQNQLRGFGATAAVRRRLRKFPKRTKYAFRQAINRLRFITQISGRSSD
jgi:hypothetical protein